MNEMWDLLIVGAGPAGLSAAIAATRYDLCVKVIDEFPKVGGRLLGQLHEESKGNWWNGVEEAGKLEKQSQKLGVVIETGISVYDLESTELGWRVYTSEGEENCKKLLLATGATEVPNPVPGWTYPGVMSVGAAQVMGNVHRVKPGDSCVIIGVNVLSVAIAHELKLNGVHVKQIILPPHTNGLTQGAKPTEVMDSLMNLTHLAPSAILRSLGKLGRYVPTSLATTVYPRFGMKVFDIPIKIKTAAKEIIGRDEKAIGVKTVEINRDGKAIPDSEKVVEADFVCISGGLAPLPELAALSGCKFKYVKELGGHIPFHNERMETNKDNLYVAGNITGVESAKVAITQGTVAGLSAAIKSIAPSQQLESEIVKAVQQVKETRQEALIQFQPGINHARKELYDQFERENRSKTEQLSVM